MNRRYHIAVLIAVSLTLAVAAGSALAQAVPEAAPTYAGHVLVDLSKGGAVFSPAPTSAQILGDVYSNTSAAPNFGFTSTDLAAIYGDEVLTIGGGILDQNDFTVYNSSSGTGTLLTASYIISLYNGTNSALLGSYITNPITFSGGGLAPGFYTVITVTGLSALSINLPVNDIVITQTMASHTGTPTKLGIVSMDPPSIGSSSATMYISATTVGPAGFYTITGSNANPGYRINTLNPVPARTSTWGMLKALYR